ncbi:hypothetical protein H7X46_07940 [Pseudonocardia sp. C8]|uniref:hypothetical protein n=1 Tax=Pseudonocardia sp. C8 TaxID=2762759 RepID=UPI001642D951|nr:hypothetical protein [Pseudonocardia sp. C8]MBC3190990.1 hypothetical protein [Pseudonocardia sp. C8]
MAELRARRDRLRTELAEVTAQRRQVEATAGRGVEWERAIAVVRRDRDSGRSPLLLRQRAVFEQVMAQFEQVEYLIARLATRLSDPDADVGERRRGQAACERGLAAIQCLVDTLRATPPDAADGVRGRGAR